MFISDAFFLHQSSMCSVYIQNRPVSQCLCASAYVHTSAGNHHFNIALIKLPVYRCRSTQEPSLGRFPPAAAPAKPFEIQSGSGPCIAVRPSCSPRSSLTHVATMKRLHCCQLAANQLQSHPRSTCWESARCDMLFKKK